MFEITHTPSQDPPSISRWLRLVFKLFVGLILVTTLALACIYFYHRHRATRALEDAIAETNRLDPGWRLEDIENRRAALPDDQNAAIPIAAAARFVPNNWLQKREDLWNLNEEPPQFQLPSQVIEPLRKALQPMLPALPLLQNALPLRTGHSHVKWKPDMMSTLLPHLDYCQDVSSFLLHLAMLQSQDDKHDDALQSTLLILAAARSIGEEPTAVSQLVRKKWRLQMVRNLERCLAQGSVQDALLDKAHGQLAIEAADPVFYYAMFGDRAGMDHFFTNLEAGNLGDWKSDRESIPSRFFFSLHGGTFKDQHAWYLIHMNKIVAASKLPPREQLIRLQELQDSAIHAPLLPRMLLPAYVSVLHATIRSHAILSCASAAIAVERFRLKNNRWPESLDEVVAAKLLDKVPEDPYDGKPLRYRKTPDGVVVYSISKDGTYAGDALDADREYDPNLIRYEFRLWDEAHRRQPPRPKADQKKDGGSL